jgi:hypothetical protein
VKKLLLVPVTVVTAFLAFAFLQPGTAGGVVRAIAPTLLAALPSTISQANGSGPDAQANNGGSGSSAQGSAQAGSPSGSAGTTGTLSNPSDAQVNPETKIDTVHQVSTAGKVNCGRFGGGYHGGKHLFVCPNPPFPPPANR